MGGTALPIYKVVVIVYGILISLLLNPQCRHLITGTKHLFNAHTQTVTHCFTIIALMLWHNHQRPSLSIPLNGRVKITSLEWAPSGWSPHTHTQTPCLSLCENRLILTNSDPLPAFGLIIDRTHRHPQHIIDIIYVHTRPIGHRHCSQGIWLIGKPCDRMPSTGISLELHLIVVC